MVDHLGPEAAKGLAHQMRQQPPSHTPGTLEYWRERALVAEAQVRRLQQQASDDGWRLDNYRQEAQRRRDAEIGEMGGGG